MFKLVHKLHDILNSLKGFEAGYTTKNLDSMVMQYDGKIYRIDIKQIDEGYELKSKHFVSLEGDIGYGVARQIFEAQESKKTCSHRFDNIMLTTNPPQKKCLDCGKYIVK